MKINTKEVLRNIAGQPLLDLEEKVVDNKIEKVPVEATLKMALVNAALSPALKDKDGMDKMKKFDLAERIYNSDEVDLTAEEIAFLQKAVNEVYPSPLIVGRVNRILEGK